MSIPFNGFAFIFRYSLNIWSSFWCIYFCNQIVFMAERMQKYLHLRTNSIYKFILINRVHMISFYDYIGADAFEFVVMMPVSWSSFIKPQSSIADESFLMVFCHIFINHYKCGIPVCLRRIHTNCTLKSIQDRVGVRALA